MAELMTGAFVCLRGALVALFITTYSYVPVYVQTSIPNEPLSGGERLRGRSRGECYTSESVEFRLGFGSRLAPGVCFSVCFLFVRCVLTEPCSIGRGEKMGTEENGSE